jgi:ABC-type Zn uptake system ZnuABC Zn-binding protein ZnuA
MTFENPEACPAETTIQVFHMEEGEHILEFESVHEEDFNMAVLKMLGGHAHHDHHGHGDHADERDIAIEGNWVDEWGTNQTIDSDSWNSGTITQFDNSAMWAVAENGEDSFNPGLWSKYDWTWDSEELYYCQSTFAAESEADALSANSANSSDLEAGCGGFPWSQMSNADSDHDGHDDHDDHGDDMCHNTETHENYESTEEECEAAGHMWTGDGEHDEHHGEEMCHNTDTHENYESNEEDCESAGHVWMGHDDHDLPEIHSELVAHTFSFPEEMVCYDINTHTVNMSLTTESDCQAAGLMWTAANSGPSGDDQSDEEEHHEMGAVVIHIEAEGDYGFALPNDIRMHIVMGERGHDGHDGHDDHGDDDDRDDHDDDDHGDDDDRDDHDDEIEAGDEEEVFTYDPHSWLSPIAFEAQINVVLTRLTSIFPDGSDSFTENAASYSVQLMDLHERYTAAFGVDGTCDMAGQEKTIVANHNAYSYMAVQYDIDIITLHGLDPEGEPSPADIAEVVESIEEKGITVLFVEEFTDQTALNSIVEQTGVTIEILYTMEMAPSDSSDNYLSMMNKNLENIISGCGC